MACKYICDGCGKEQSSDVVNGEHFKPRLWFQRGDEAGVQDACSRPCIDKVAKDSGKTSVVIPV